MVFASQPRNTRRQDAVVSATPLSKLKKKLASLNNYANVANLSQ